MVLPIQIVVDASSLHKCTDEEGAEHANFQQPACSAPSFFSTKKRSSYSQSKAQMNHPQRISRLLVAVLNATCTYCVMVLGWLKKEERKKKERKKERKKKKEKR